MHESSVVDKNVCIGANIVAFLGIVASMTQPAILRFAPVLWQFIIQVIYCIIYIGFGVYGVKVGGLTGFIFALGIANVVKILVLYILGIVYIKE